MAASDRTQFKQDLAGSLGSSRTVVNAALCAAQDAQRFHMLQVGGTAIVANTNVNLCGPRVDRPVQVKEVRILPGGALTADTGNLVVQYGYTNDNSATFTVMGSINTNTSGANGGTGTWAYGTSIVVTPNLAVNAIVPSGSQMGVQLVTTAPSRAIPAGTTFQILGEEV